MNRNKEVLKARTSHEGAADLSSGIVAAGAIQASGVERPSALAPRHLGNEDKETETSFEQKVEAAKKALAERYADYEVDGHQITEADFGLIETVGEDGETIHTVMLTSLSGIDLGDPNKDYDPARTYDSIMADESHVIEVNGIQIDTRILSKDAYFAFINTEIAKGKGTDTNSLPDSRDLKIWTDTWLLAERVDHGDALVGNVIGSWPNVRRIHCGSGARYDAFRPAVVIV